MENENPQLQMQNPRIYVEKTLIIIKPDAMKHKEKIENFILNKGFTILKVTFTFESNIFHIFKIFLLEKTSSPIS